ncbi:hypothetical protein ACNHUS_24310 [Actinomycetes bacterium M1A6_2h]
MSFTFRPTRAVVAVAFVFLLAGCGSTIQGNPVAQSGTVPATGSSPSSTASPRTTMPPLTGVDEGGDVDIDVEIGDCVELGGTVEDATIDNAVCGSPESNYKVVSKVPSGDLCGSDVDQYYYETLRGVEQGALCLDIDFVVGGCMDMGTPDPTRVDCNASAIEAVRVIDILQGTSDVDSCPDPANSGYTHDERNFVVCVEEL